MKRVVFASILALLIIGGIAFSYFYYQRYKVPRADAFGIIPKDAAFVLESRNFPRFIEHLANNQPWKCTAGFAFFQRCSQTLSYADSICRKNPKLKSFLEENTVFISAHIVNTDKLDFLFTVSLPRSAQESSVNEAMAYFFGDIKPSGKRSYQGVAIRQIDMPDGRVFSYAIVRGLLTGSCTAYLVEDAIRQSKLPLANLQSKGFTEVYEAAGKNVDANLFIRHENFAKMLVLLLNKENSALIDPLVFFARWTGLDVKLKEANLTLSGYSTVADTTDYLSIFRNQPPPAPALFKQLSKKTALVAYTAFADPKSFYNKLNTFRKRHPDAQNTEVEKLNVHYSVNLEENVLAWLGNEYALAVNECGSQGWENHAYAVIRCRDTQLALKNLKVLSYAAERKDNPGEQHLVSEQYKEHAIAYLALPGWLPALFGSDFRSLGKVFYTFVGDYVVFANQASALRSFIDDNLAGRTMEHDPLYKSVSENVPGKSNRFIYVNIARSYPMLLSFASSGLLDALQANAPALKSLGACTFQAIGDGDKVYTHVMLHRPAVTKSDVALRWSTTLDTTMSKKPWLVTNPLTGEQDLLAQDDNNVLYFIDQQGAVIWKDSIDEPILSDVVQVDYYHNDKYQFLFNTASAVHLIDRKMDPVKGYPRKLNPMATAGLTVVDYDKKKDYRVFIPCGNKLLAQQLNGKPIEGWKFKGNLGYMDQALQYFKLADKDLLLFSDTLGDIHLVDRKGKDRVAFAEGINTHVTSPYQIEKGQTIEQSRFVALDNCSKVVSLFFDGTAKKEQAPKGLTPSAFGLLDLNADLSSAYVFLADNEVQAMSQDSMALYNHRFKDATAGIMQLFQQEEGHGFIGVVCPRANEVYLFNEDGSIKDGFPLKGNTGIILIQGSAGEKSVLICGSADKVINCYSIE